jgi:hypothetical protein
MWRSLVLLGLAACSFGGNPVADDVADDTPPIDAPPGTDGDLIDADPADPDAPIDAFVPLDFVDHLPSSVEDLLTGGGVWDASSPVSIDTTTGTVDPNPGDGVIVVADAPQDDPGSPHVMVIQAASVELSNNLTIVGDKPLVIVATTTILISDEVDASATSLVAGPGGFGSELGPGAGVSGDDGTLSADSGGSGGAYGGNGGKGGNADGVVGPSLNINTYGGAEVLTGGSGGGRGSPNPCGLTTPIVGGAGGGALQLSARTSIELTGSIDVGGGGGGRGKDCGGVNGGSGGGGGSGGMLYLQSPVFLGGAILGANGGGGGGGSSDGGATMGGPGTNATAAAGGLGGGGSGDGGGGGGGASGTADGGAGADRSGINDNAGGGGGGTGRIYCKGGSCASFTASPAATPL